MAARIINAISVAEFAQMLYSVKPPSGWSETIAVANSGGPDSTCLLFLLNRHLKERAALADVSHSSDQPRRPVSLSIDHNLQPSSGKMAEIAGVTAKQLGVEHATIKLAWGERNNPRKPESDDKFEEVARSMRYRAFLKKMPSLNATALAMGHHIDDQVETMLMRLGRGTGRQGLAGMRPCRRWGMGDGVETQIEGLRRWIVRPLLSIAKDRILATCEENKLNYIHDPTNFQPQLTIRNAIRDIIKSGGTDAVSPDDPDIVGYPPDIAAQLAAINQAAVDNSTINFSLGSSLEHLRKVNRKIRAAVSDSERQVDDIILNGRVSSPPGTFAISAAALKSIEDPDIRETLLYRTVRYVSPRPWGDAKAELGRRKTSMQRLITHLWDFPSLQKKDNRSICVGSGVWWRPVAIRQGRVRWAVKGANLREVAWLATRQPDPRPSEALQDFRLNVTQSILARLSQLEKSPDVYRFLELLYDHRFLIRFDLEKIPVDVRKAMQTGAEMFIVGEEPWVLPKVVLEVNGSRKTIHTNIVWSQGRWKEQWGMEGEGDDVLSGWMVIRHFRPISAI